MSAKNGLRIKTNVVKRLIKELKSYQKEEIQHTEKLESMKQKNADPYDIKYQTNILYETLTMIPDTEKRLKEHFQILNNFLDANFREPIQLIMQKDNKPIESGDLESSQSTDEDDSSATGGFDGELITSLRDCRGLFMDIAREYPHLTVPSPAFEIKQEASQVEEEAI